MNDAETGSDDDQGAEKADRDGRPAVNADRFAKKRGAEHGDDERCDKGNGDSIGQGYELQGDNEQRCGTRDRGSPQDLQDRAVRFQHRRAAKPQYDEYPDQQPELPRPGDLQRIAACR